MPPNTPSSPDPFTPPSVPAPAPKKTRWLLYGCGTLLALLLVIVATVAITLWWIQRPIKPVVLSAPEKADVEEKLQHLGGGKAPASHPRPRGKNSSSNRAAAGCRTRAKDRTRPYVPGSKVLKLTEREINGLLNANTDLGQIRAAGVRKRRRQCLRERAHPAGFSRRRRQDVPRSRALPRVAGQ